jgi:hypothetical protein
MKAQLRRDNDLTLFVINENAYYAAEIPIEGFQGYWASSTGEIISTKQDEPIVMSEFDQVGYRKTTLYTQSKQKHYRVHRLVASTFFETPDLDANRNDRLQVNHIDGCRSNNRASNLEWVTQDENGYHARVMYSSKDNKDYMAKAKERDDARRT